MLLDVVAAVPWDYMACTVLTVGAGWDLEDAGPAAAAFKLLHLARMYRVRDFFR